jgi:hypothetical protein
MSRADEAIQRCPLVADQRLLQLDPKPTFGFAK